MMAIRQKVFITRKLVTNTRTTLPTSSTACSATRPISSLVVSRRRERKMAMRENSR